jgi:3,4-dihydroxy 2-butanone 4-phosphate synthase / GTP cyclohydrolase II
LTNNPQKITDLEACNIQIEERVAYHVKPRAENRRYLDAKIKKCGHIVHAPHNDKETVRHAST